MLKNIFTLVFLFLITIGGTAQVGIGTTTPDGSSALEVTATDKGFLMPRMTTAQRESIASPATGLLVYDNETNSIWYFDGTAWNEGTGGAGKFVDGAAVDIAYYEGRVGIGRNTFSTGHKLYVEDKKDDNSIHTATKIVGSYEGTGTNEATYALGAEASNDGSGTIDQAGGTVGGVINGTGGKINWAIGSWDFVKNKGNISYGAGALGRVINEQGTVTTGIGSEQGIENHVGAQIDYAYLGDFYAQNYGTITDLYGGFFVYYGNGSVTNSYAIYVDGSFNKGTDTNYAIYSAPDIDTYIEGNVGIGTNTPERKVHISGVMRLEPQDTPPADGKLGDIYVDTDGLLYFYSTFGSNPGWKAVSLITP